MVIQLISQPLWWLVGVTHDFLTQGSLDPGLQRYRPSIVCIQEDRLNVRGKARQRTLIVINEADRDGRLISFDRILFDINCRQPAGLHSLAVAGLEREGIDFRDDEWTDNYHNGKWA